MKHHLLVAFAAFLTTLTTTAQTTNFQSSDRLDVVTNLSTAQGPKLVNNAGTEGAANPNYASSVVNRHALLLTGADTGSGASAAVDQKGRLTPTNAIPASPHFQVLSPGLLVRGKAGTTFVPAQISIAYEFFRFSGGSWVRWSASGGPPSFSATLNINNESRVVRDLSGNPLANQDHSASVSAVTYIPVFWFGEANRPILETQKVSLRMTVTIPSTKDGVTTTEKFVRMFTPFDGGSNLETPTCVTIQKVEGSLQFASNLLPPVTGSGSGPWVWQHSNDLQDWNNMTGTGNPFSFVAADDFGSRQFFRLSMVTQQTLRHTPAQPTFVGGWEG